MTIDTVKEDIANLTMIHGENHVAVALAYSELGKLLFEDDQLSAAQCNYQKALEIVQQTDGENSELAIDIHYRIGKVMEAKALETGNSEPVKKYQQKTLKLRQNLDSSSKSIDTRSTRDDMDSTLIYGDAAEDAQLKGDLEGAKALYLKSIELRRKKFGEDSPALVTILIPYAELLKVRGNWDEAKAVLEEALAISMNKNTKNNKFTADVMNDLGLVLKLLGNYKAAEQYLMEALQIRRTLFGDVDIHVAASLNNVAEMCREMENYEKAIEYHRLAIEIFENVGGAEHPGTVNAKGNLGITLRRFSQVNLEQGVQLLKGTVDYLHANNYGENHPWLVKFSNEHTISQAQKLGEQGKFDQSLELYNSVLQKKQQMNQLPSSPGGGGTAASPGRATTKSLHTTAEIPGESQELMMIHRGRFAGMLEKAKQLLQKAKFFEAEEVLNECGQFDIEQLNNEKDRFVELKVVHCERLFLLGDHKSALECLAEALQERIDIFGPEHPALLSIVLPLGRVYRAIAKYDEAETFLNQAVKFADSFCRSDIKSVGKASPEHALSHITALQEMAELHRHMGNYTVTISLITQAVKAIQDHLLTEDVIAAECYTTLGCVEAVKACYPAAMDYFKQAYDIRVMRYSKHHPKCAASLLHMVEIHLKLGQFEQCDALLSEAKAVIDMFYFATSFYMTKLTFLRAKLAFARYQLEDAGEFVMSALEAYYELLDEAHPAVLRAQHFLALVQMKQGKYAEALTAFQHTLSARKEVFNESVTHPDIIDNTFSLAKWNLLQGACNTALSLLQECIDMQERQNNELEVSYHSVLADIWLVYGRLHIVFGNLQEGTAMITKAGVHYLMVYGDKSMHLAAALCEYAAVTRLQGQHKDAKYQYSVCMSMAAQAVGQMHPLVWDILYAATDNMREVGYFHDAFETLTILEDQCIPIFGKDSLAQARLFILHGKILTDRAKGIKAEPLFEAASVILDKLFTSEVFNLYKLDWTIALAKCYYRQNKIVQAEKLFQEAYAWVSAELGENNETAVDIQHELRFMKLSAKPAEQLNSQNYIKDVILPFYTSLYGIAHPQVAHAKGRIGVLMNSLKKDSGRKLVYEALKFFDEHKQFPYTYDHPWVMELGGYEKNASKDRLSKTISEGSVGNWALPSNAGEEFYGKAPKFFWIDTINAVPEAWGQVHYSGPEPKAERIQRLRSPSMIVNMGGGGKFEALVSLKTKAKKTKEEEEEPEEPAPTAPVVSAAETGVNQEQLYAEVALRKQAEDNLIAEQHARKDMEEQLALEQDARKALDERLAAESKEKEELAAKFAEMQAQFEEMKRVIEAAENERKAAEEQRRLLEESMRPPEPATPAAPAEVEAAAATEGEKPAEGEATVSAVSPEAASTTATAPTAATVAAVSTGGDNTANLPPSDGTPVTYDSYSKAADKVMPQDNRSALDAAEFIFKRAMLLQEQGWYKKAQPLFEECYRVREEVLPGDYLTNNALFYLATNHSLLHQWTVADEKYKQCLLERDKICTIHSEPYALVMMHQAINYLKMGKYDSAATRFAETSKLLSGMEEPTAIALFGECLCHQAECSLSMGRVAESKALIERGYAILFKRYGSNHSLTAYSNHVRCEILRFSGKFKEGINVVEQNLILRKRLWDDAHPCVVETLLLLGQFYVETNKLTDALSKFQLAYDMAVTYFGENDLMVAHILHNQGIVACLENQFQTAMDLFERARTLRYQCCVEHHVDMGDSYQAIGECLMFMGKYFDAEALLLLAEKIRGQNLPESITAHPKLSETKCSLGQLYRFIGNYDKSKVLLDESLDERRNLYGKEHKVYLANQLQMAHWYADNGQMDNALKYIKRNVKLLKDIVGEDHTDYAASLLLYAELLRRQENYAEANTVVDEAAKIYNLHFSCYPAHTMISECALLHGLIKLSIIEKALNTVPEPIAKEEGEEGDDEHKSHAEEEEEHENPPAAVEEPAADAPAAAEENEEDEHTATEAHTTDGEESRPVTAVKKQLIVPVFDNASFLEVVEIMNSGYSGLQKLFANSDTHPLAVYARGCIGQAKLLEHSALQRWIENLSMEDREVYRADENRKKQNVKEVRTKPVGLLEIEAVLKLLKEYPLTDIHHWVVKFQLIVDTVVFTLDDMDIAANTFIEAEALRKSGRFHEAEEKYDAVFITQLTCLGAMGASTNLVVAETLYGKAENCRMMGNMELSKILYDQSISIFRRKLGNECDGVMKGLLGQTEIFTYHGLYEDALAMHQQALMIYNVMHGDASASSARCLTLITYDYYRLGKLDKAMSNAVHALSLYNKLSGYEADDLSSLQLCMAYIYLAQSQFQLCLENMDYAKTTLDKQYSSNEDHIAYTDILQCRAEHLHAVGKYTEAHETMTRVMKQRLRSFGRSEKQKHLKTSDRRLAFYEAFDLLSLHSAEEEQIEKKKAAAGGRMQSTRMDAEEKALEDEMSAIRTSIAEEFGGDDITFVSTVAKFSKQDHTPAPFLFKGRPVAAHPIIAQCLFLRGRMCLSMCEFNEAKEMLDGALAMMNKLFARPSQRKLAISFELANLMTLRGSFEEARAAQMTILQQRMQLCDEEHPDKADSMHELAKLCVHLSLLDDTTQLLTEAVAIRQKVYGEQHWKVADAYITCADVLHIKGFYADAAGLYEKAMVIMQKTFGELHPLIASILIGQALNALELGHLDQATSLIEQCKAMRIVLLGESHPEVGMCHYFLAKAQRAKGRVLDTRRSLDMSIAALRQSLGKYHPFTATVLLYMAYNFMDLSKYSTAEHVFNRANQLLRKAYGKDHLIVAFGMTGLAENFRATAKYDKAKEFHEKALYLHRKLLGERHHLVAESMFYLSEISFVYGKTDDAIKGFDDTIAIQRMCLGENHPAIASTMLSLGRVFLSVGKLSDAKYSFERSLSMRKGVLGGEHPSVGDAQFHLAQISRKYGRLDQCAAQFERCLTSVKDTHGSRHPIVASILYHIGEVSNVMGKYQYAREVLIESLQIRVSVFKEMNENHPEIAESYYGIAENMRLCGQFDVAPAKRSEKGFGMKHANLNRSALESGPSESNIVSQGQLENGPAGVDDIGESVLDDGSSVREEKTRKGLLGGKPTRAVTAPALLEGGESSLLESTGMHTGSAVINSIAATPLERQAEENSQVSAPTVMISAIEQLDVPGTIAEESNVDDYSIPGGMVQDGRTVLEELGLFKAIPLYEKVMDHWLQTFDANHPFLVSIRFSIAETMKAMGNYQKALAMHEEILATRRSTYGDQHPDSVMSMVAVGETLRAMSKIFPDNPQGSLEAKQMRRGKDAVSVGVTLIDHFHSALQPTPPLPSPTNHTINWFDNDDTLKTGRTKSVKSSQPSHHHRPQSTGGALSPAREEKKWVFLSQPNADKKKKEVLKTSKGYMGYPFPAPKKITKPESHELTKPKKALSGDALGLFNLAYNSQRKVFGENADHPITASILFGKAELYRARRDYTLSTQCNEQALLMRRKLYRGSHPLIGDCLNSMAEILRVEGKYTQAAPLYEKVLEIRTNAYNGTNHPSVAEVQNNIAMLYFAQGKYNDAQMLFEDALGSIEDMLGPMHPSCAILLGNLAGLHHSAGRYDIALKMYFRALEIKKEAYGAAFPDVASTMNNIGLIYKAQRRYEEALEYFEETLETYRRVFGSTHPDVASSMNNLAALYEILGRKYEAKDLYKQSIVVRNSLFDLDHPSVAATKNNYGVLLYSLEEYEEAKDMFDDALRIRMKILGENHPTVAETLNNLGLLLFTQGHRHEAIPLFDRALEIKISAFGPENPSVATSMNNLAGLHYKLGNLQQALILYEQAYDIRNKTYGANHEETAASLKGVTAVERDMKKLGK